MKAKTKKLLSLVIMICVILASIAPVQTQASVKLNATSKTLSVGQSFVLKVSGTFERVKWSSNKSSVASVNQSGKVTAKKAGNATIKAKVSGKTLKCKVKVKSSGSATMGEKNALRKAQQYLDFMAFSYDGLVKQLEYEGFSKTEAIYGADNCGANWKEQAAKKAETYLDMMGFSKEKLIQQLEYEGFTHDQAVYGAESNGY